MEENKMFLEFKVDRQIINRIDNLKPVEDSVNYLYLHFTFSSDWDGLKKRVTFIRIDGSITSYLDENDNCVVPPYMNQYSGFYVTLVGENEEKQILVTTNKKFVGVTKSGGIEVMDALLRYIETKTLDYKKLGEIAYLEIPNIYGTKLKFLKESGTIQLLGRNENNDEIVLNEIDLDTERIITNIYYDAEKESLIFQFENSPDIEVPIGDIFELDDYYTKTQIDALLSALKQELINYTNEKENALQTQINSVIEDISNKDIEYKNTFSQINDKIDNTKSDLESKLNSAVNDLENQINDTNNNLSNLDNKVENYNTSINNNILNIQTQANITSNDILNIESEVYGNNAE